MRYCKQKLKYECGPIAILNLMKWLGLRVTYKKDMPSIKMMCKYKKGVYNEDITRALNKLDISFWTRGNTVEHNLIQACLRNPDGAVVISYDPHEADEESHIIFADNINDDVVEAYKAYKIDQVWFFKRGKE